MKKAKQFIILTCSVSWIVAGLGILFGLRPDNRFYIVFTSIYMLFPAICAIILQVIYNEKPFRNLNISFRLNWWFLIAGIVPFLNAFITLGINLLFPNVSFSYTQEGFLGSLPFIVKVVDRQILPVQLVSALIVGSFVNSFPAFGEELGWRGYLLKVLETKQFLLVSLITGIVWGLWHFPFMLIGQNYPQYPIAGVGMMIINCILLSPVMTYITIKSKSVITASIFHGCLNAIGGFSKIYLVGGNDLTNGVIGIAGFISLLFVNCVFFLYDKYITKENIFTKRIVKST